MLMITVLLGWRKGFYVECAFEADKAFPRCRDQTVAIGTELIHPGPILIAVIVEVDEELGESDKIFTEGFQPPFCPALRRDAERLEATAFPLDCRVLRLVGKPSLNCSNVARMDEATELNPFDRFVAHNIRRGDKRLDHCEREAVLLHQPPVNGSLVEPKIGVEVAPVQSALRHKKCLEFRCWNGLTGLVNCSLDPKKGMRHALLL